MEGGGVSNGDFGSRRLIVIERKSIFLGWYENTLMSQDTSWTPAT